jgi:hypothetical protein
MWLKLTADQVHRLYKVPQEIAEDKTYEFYESSFQSRLRSQYDGPWSLIAVQIDSETSEKLALQVANIEHEQLSWSGFDPLQYPGNFLLLRKPAVLDLVDLLLSYAARLQESEPRGSVFTKLDKDGLATFRFEGEVFTNHTQLFYIQTYSPLTDDQSESKVTIVFFSSINPQPSELLFIGISQFSREILNNSEVDPTSQSLARIVLNKSGLEELANLIKAESQHLTEV